MPVINLIDFHVEQTEKKLELMKKEINNKEMQQLL